MEILFACRLTTLRYVLSPTHLHEFKSADKTQAPIMSLFLPEQKLGSHSTEGSSSNKFMLKGRQTGAMHRGHSWVFRAESYETMLAWVSDIKSLTEKTPQERNAFVRQHARSISGSSQKASSVSSDGMDEEDEEPFSATASSVMAQGPKQDVLPRRPQPGGRFPSDIRIETQRGLQAPLSPSSGSSGFGDFKDHDVIAAAGSLPGSGIGQHYGQDTSPTHAAIVNQYAKEDGINPYTHEPLQDNDVPGEQSAALLGAAGLGSAALEALGSETYHNYEEEIVAGDPEPATKQLEDQAALESLKIASPDTYEQQSEQQAALEATVFAAPNTDLVPVPSSSKHMSGGRSIGDLSTVDGNIKSDAVVDGHTQDAPLPVEDGVHEWSRPTLSAGVHHESVASISQLHIPGEFPKGARS